MKVKKRGRKIGVAIGLFLLGFFFVPGFRSEAVMRPVSALAYRDSVMKQKGFHVILPDGCATWERDWTSSMKLFHAKAFESAEHPISATILYNFAYFSGGRSLLYDVDSPYEMAYYGAYAISREGLDRPFGFDENAGLNWQEVSLIPLYDLEVLVLRGLGCPADLAQAEIVSFEANPVDSEAQLAGWIRIDAVVETRSLIHRAGAWNQNDLQYGSPPKDAAEDFPPLTLQGRIYAKAFPEWDSTVFLYVFAKDRELIEATDRDFLQKVEIYGRDLWAP